ncbi:hypothetical protein MTR67_034130 [Solanum verrucosum]|uniref:Uncharacterized protein n=1 Tax=Solanum verrucosum TaxID=315347 RepID=A0AAF0ZK11_SOLVR|nr:hypothetical protein MTR67_034130 [Solanum verrucosum]
MCNTVFSKDLADPFSDSKVELKDMIWGVMEEAGKINLADFFPILEKIDLQRIRYRVNNHFGKLFKFLDDLINERLEEKQRSHGEKNDVLKVVLNFSAENPKEIDQNHIKSMLLVRALLFYPLNFRDEKFQHFLHPLLGLSTSLFSFKLSVK